MITSHVTFTPSKESVHMKYDLDALLGISNANTAVSRLFRYIIYVFTGIVFLSFLAAIGFATYEVSSTTDPQYPKPLLSHGGAIIASIIAPVIVGTLIVISLGQESEVKGEAAARERLRVAESRLSNIGATPSSAEVSATAAANATAVEALTEIDNKDDLLTLSDLWEVTHSRLDLYHEIATGQARRSFITAQAATAAGFILLVIFAVLSATARSTAAAITSGGLGAVSAALVGYIGRTFIRSQETSATHLRAYFDQPLEFSKYLAAERLLATAARNLDDNQRAAVLASIVQAMVAAPQANAKNAQDRGHSDS
jgi:hypothetical protein